MYLTFSAHPNWAVLGREKQQRQRRERHWQQQQKQQQQQQLSLYLGMSCREHRTGREMPPPKSQPLISIWVVFLFSLSFSCCCCCWEEKETAREREVCFRKKSFLFCFERWFLYLFFSFGLLFLTLSLFLSLFFCCVFEAEVKRLLCCDLVGCFLSVEKEGTNPQEMRKSVSSSIRGS